MEKEKKKERQPQIRKPFEKPRLHIYGNVRTLTKASFNSKGHSDGGHLIAHKTAG